MLGDDILYVSKVPWTSDQDDWTFRNRREIKSEYAERLQTIIDATRGSQLLKAVADFHHVQEHRAWRLPGEQRVHSRHDR